MKTCTKCQRFYEKPQEAFSKNKLMKDGLQIYCKSCRSAMNKKPKVDSYCVECNSYLGLGSKKKRCPQCTKERELNRKAKLYLNDEEFRKKNNERSKEWRKKNKVKYRKQMKEHNQRRYKEHVPKKINTYKNIDYWVERLRKVWAK